MQLIANIEKGTTSKIKPWAIAGAPSVPPITSSTTACSVIKPEHAQAAAILTALGGRENLVAFDTCITRLRIVVKNSDLVNEAQIKTTGAAGIIKLDKQNIQILYGVHVHLIKDQLEKYLLS